MQHNNTQVFFVVDFTDPAESCRIACSLKILGLQKKNSYRNFRIQLDLLKEIFGPFVQNNIRDQNKTGTKN